MNSAYISGALMGSADLTRARALYTEIASACANAGWRAYLPHENTDPQFTGEMVPEDVMLRDLCELEKSDAIIAYIGEPSLGVGAEIVLAMQQNKPILAVQDTSKPVSRFIRGLLLKYHSAYLYSFNSVDELQAWVSRTLTEKIPTRCAS